jgi:hypothetical protein
MTTAEQNLAYSLQSVENITKAVDQLVHKEIKRRNEFKDLLISIKACVVQSKRDTIDGIVKIEKGGTKLPLITLAEKLAVQLSEIELIISNPSLEQMGNLMKIVTSEDYKEARSQIDLRS